MTKSKNEIINNKMAMLSNGELSCMFISHANSPLRVLHLPDINNSVVLMLSKIIKTTYISIVAIKELMPKNKREQLFFFESIVFIKLNADAEVNNISTVVK